MASIFRTWADRASIISLVLLSSLTSYTIAASWGDWHGNTIYVNAGQSIQAAIDSAYAGQLIIVGPGTFAEQLTVTTDGLQLVGKGAVLVPPSSFVQNTCSGLAGNNFGAPGSGSEAGICVTGKDIVFGAFVQHRQVVSVGTPIKDVLVTGFQIQGFNGINIAVVGGQDVQIVGNTLHDGTSYGVLSVASPNSHIDANHVASTGDLLFIGVCMDNSPGVKITNNDVSNYGTAFCVQTSGAYLSNNRIQNTCWGFFVDPGINGAQILDNYVGPSNPVCDNLPQAAVLGVLLFGASGTTVQGNTIEGRQANGGVNGPGVGVLITDDPTTSTIANDNKILNNILRNNDVDIRLATNGTGNVVQGNKCTTPPNLCSS